MCATITCARGSRGWRPRCRPTSIRCSQSSVRKPAKSSAATGLRESASVSSAPSTCATPVRATRLPCPAASSRWKLMAQRSCGQALINCTSRSLAIWRRRSRSRSCPIACAGSDSCRRSRCGNSSLPVHPLIARCASVGAYESAAPSSTARSISASGSMWAQGSPDRQYWSSSIALRPYVPGRSPAWTIGRTCWWPMHRQKMAIDAIELEVVKASLSGIVQEMQNSLFRTGFSTIIRESQDASCALMNARGQVGAQHVVLPLHIGAFGASTAAVIAAFDDIAEGDAFLINHPYEGGSPHAPDIAVITPAFAAGSLFGFCGSIAHKSDIGGPVPGSCSGQAREIFNEGLHLPAVRYQRGWRANADLERLIAANSRTPELVLGDIRGQLGADRLGERRLGELIVKFGSDKISSCCDRLLDVSERKLKSAVAEWPDGRFEAGRFADDDGIELEKPVRIHVVVEKQGDALAFDFSGSADQTKGPANIRPPLVQAACAYALISLIDPNLHVSTRLVRGFTMTAREGSVLNPRFPAPVNTYNPTVHALVDAIFAAMSHIAPQKVRADAARRRSIILGGRNTYTGRGYVQYEIIAGGAGARARKDGMSGTTVNQSHARIAAG